MEQEVKREISWDDVLAFFEKRFQEKLDVDGILYLIGVQELGKGPKNFSKDEKLDVIHIAVCTLMEPYGYYEFIGHDEDGWPHFERKKKLPFLKGADQDRLMQDAITNYMSKVLQA